MGGGGKPVGIGGRDGQLVSSLLWLGAGIVLAAIGCDPEPPDGTGTGGMAPSGGGAGMPTGGTGTGG